MASPSALALAAIWRASSATSSLSRPKMSTAWISEWRQLAGMKSSTKRSSLPGAMRVPRPTIWA